VRAGRATPAWRACWWIEGADSGGWTPLIVASQEGHISVVHLLLGHRSARGTINRRNHAGKTALGWACHYGHWKVARALLKSGANPTIADVDGTTPMAIAKRRPEDHVISSNGRRRCVAVLEVSLYLLLCPT
jgi:ankyrin repeat protein